MPIKSSIDALVQTHAGVVKMTFHFEGEFSDVITMAGRLLSTEGVFPVIMTETPKQPPVAPANGKTEPTTPQEGVRSRVIVGLKMAQGKSQAGKDYHYWLPHYDDPTGIKVIGRIFTNGAIADQLRNLVPEQHRPSKLNTYTPIPPEYQFKMFYTLKDLPDGKKMSEVQYLEPNKAAGESTEYPYDDSIPF